MAYLVVCLDVELDLLSGKGSHSNELVSLGASGKYLKNPCYAHNILDLHLDCSSLTRASVGVAAGVQVR